MSSRREFLSRLSATAGIAAGAGAVLAQTQKVPKAPTRGKRVEIKIAGRRVRTIDTWSHINGVNQSFEEIWKLVPKNQKIPPPFDKQAEKFRSQAVPKLNPRGPEVEKRLADMDAMGIDMEVLSVGFNYWAERALSRDITQLQNERISEMCAAYPDRFAGFGTLSLQYPDLAVEEMEAGAKKLGMRGFSIGGFVNGKELSAPEFHPFWAKAEQLGTVIFLRGFGTVLAGGRFAGHGWLDSVVGSNLGLTLALSHLIEEGTLDLFPGLKILANRGGGYMTNDDAMVDKCAPYFPPTCQQVKKHPQAYYLKRLYYDTVHQTPEGLRHLIATVGASQVLLGTDNGGQTRDEEGVTVSTAPGSVGWNSEAVDRVLAVPGLSDADRIGILGGNAAKLLRIGLSA